jgi:diguanylate cyclase
VFVKFTADIDRSLSCAEQAIELAKAKNIPATPLNFELLFNYMSGENQSLKQDIDQLFDDDGAFSEVFALRIHNKHLSPTRQADEVEEISTFLSSELLQVQSIVSAVAGMTGAYGKSLEGIATQIKEVKNRAHLMSIIEMLVISSREMERNSNELDNKIANSDKKINSLKKRLVEIRTELRTDTLTGIANRLSFKEILEVEILAISETQEELCLCIGDIDHFKKFNDTFGYQTGDRALQLVASYIAGQVKGRDLAAGYGGAKFAIVLPQTNLRTAVTVADRIRDRVMDKELFKKSTGQSLGNITISFGVARYHSGEAIEDLIKRADTCLYSAKNAGRNQVKCEADAGVNLSNAA